MTMGITSPTSTTGQILKDGTPVISFDANNNATFAGTVVSNTPLGVRNRIINGDMVIDQRRAGASVTITADAYTLDRWLARASQSSKYTVQQNAGSVTPPAGFTNYLGITSTSAYSVVAGDFFAVEQRIEGFNTADLAWGTANARTITLSFWVRSSLTGTFGGALNNSAFNRSYPFTYTISSANTWEQKTVTIAGDTSGTWLTNNGIGIDVWFSFGVGSTYSGTAGAWSGSGLMSATGATSVVGTNGATWYITGVQLERGSTATSFEWLPYGTELALCQRYYHRITPVAAMFGSAFAVTSTQARSVIPFPVTMRIAPTALEQSGTASHYGVFFNNATTTCSSVPTFSAATTLSAQTVLTVSSGLTGGQAGNFYDNSPSSNAFLAWSTEL